MRQRVTGWVLLPCIAMLGAPDCKPKPPPVPKVVSFTVSHTHVCAGDEVTVSWEVDDAVALLYTGQGTAEIEAALEDGDPSEFGVLPVSSKVFTITEPITFQVMAFLDEDTKVPSAPLAVQLVPPPPIEWTFTPNCPSSEWASWSPTGTWTETAQVVSVENQSVDNREIQVLHAGQSWTIAPGAEAVSPVPMAGSWSLGDASLKDGEGCKGGNTVGNPGGPMLTPPLPVAMRVDYACP